MTTFLGDQILDEDTNRVDDDTKWHASLARYNLFLHNSGATARNALRPCVSNKLAQIMLTVVILTHSRSSTKSLGECFVLKVKMR